VFDELIPPKHCFPRFRSLTRFPLSVGNCPHQ
jgi:hypothetical protein